MDINESLRYLNIGLPEDILRKKMHGDFEGAIRMIDKRLLRELPEGLRQCMIAERHIMMRTVVEYPYSFEAALGKIQSLLPDFTAEDLQQRLDDGHIRWIYVNGELRIIESFIESLMGRDSAFDILLQNSDGSNSGRNTLIQFQKAMQETGEASVRIRLSASIRLKDEFFEKGMFVRVHLPLPAACPQQSNIVIEKLYPETALIAPEDAPQRTVCWEKTMEENHEFYVKYSFTHRAVYHNTADMTALPQTHTFDVCEEQPHIVFTPYIRYLAETLSTGTDDPMEKARRFYDFITLNMRYAYEPPYILLESIADHCAHTGLADCGVFALLFITLCRCAGIPAKWQSGLVAGGQSCGPHDWAQFYVEPYGWLYADCSFGTTAHWTDNEERRKFYFGNLDPCRMVANSEFQRGFTVPKKHWRDDPYDNQVGEIESQEQGFTKREFEQSQTVISMETL